MTGSIAPHSFWTAGASDLHGWSGVYICNSFANSIRLVCAGMTAVETVRSVALAVHGGPRGDHALARTMKDNCGMARQMHAGTLTGPTACELGIFKAMFR